MLFDIFSLATRVYILLIIARALMSWFDPYCTSGACRGLSRLTDPLLEPIRKRLTPLGPVDFSPMVAIILLLLLERALAYLLGAF